MNGNSKVIVKGSNGESYWIGTFLGMNEKIKGVDVPDVQNEDGEVFTCFGHVIPFSDDIVARLDKLSPGQQWSFLTAIKEWEGGKELILIRGLPGSGKSTLAKALAGHEGGQICSADDYFCINEKSEYRYVRADIGKAHAWCQRKALAAMNANLRTVVIDNTNTTLKEMRSYLPHIRLAGQLGYKVSIRSPKTAWAFDIDELVKRNSHGVPKEHIEKMFN
jgi:predicted kinase